MSSPDIINATQNLSLGNVANASVHVTKAAEVGVEEEQQPDAVEEQPIAAEQDSPRTASKKKKKASKKAILETVPPNVTKPDAQAAKKVLSIQFLFCSFLLTDLSSGS